MEINEIKLICSKARERKDLVHFKKLLDLGLTWEQYITILNIKFNFHNEFNPPHPVFSNGNERYHDITVKSLNDKKDKSFVGIFVYNKLDPMLIELKENYEVESIAKVKDFLKDVGAHNHVLKILSNLVGPENHYYIHKDDNDVFSFQVLGKVEYRIYGTDFPLTEAPSYATDLPYDSYILEPGDVVFIPKGVFHQVVVLEPRITLISDFFID